MHEQPDVRGISPDKALWRLVRAVVGHIAAGRTVLADGGNAEGGGLTVSDGSSIPAVRAVLDEALRRGLLTRSGGRILATKEARAFLRRALADPSDAGSRAALYGQHGDIVDMATGRGGADEKLRLNRAESPLGALARLKDKAGGPFLNAEAMAAGERLHADFTRAGLQPRLTMSYEPRLASKTKGAAPAGPSLCDSAQAARQRVAKAVTAIGPELSGVALDVCCFEKGLETVERERQWPARSAKLLLRAALMALARHYQPPRAPDTPGAPRAWGADGYRPDGNAFGTGTR